MQIFAKNNNIEKKIIHNVFAAKVTLSFSREAPFPPSTV